MDSSGLGPVSKPLTTSRPRNVSRLRREKPALRTVTRRSYDLGVAVEVPSHRGRADLEDAAWRRSTPTPTTSWATPPSPSTSGPRRLGMEFETARHRTPVFVRTEHDPFKEDGLAHTLSGPVEACRAKLAAYKKARKTLGAV